MWYRARCRIIIDVRILQCDDPRAMRRASSLSAEIAYTDSRTVYANATLRHHLLTFLRLPSAWRAHLYSYRTKRHACPNYPLHAIAKAHESLSDAYPFWAAVLLLRVICAH